MTPKTRAGSRALVCVLLLAAVALVFGRAAGFDFVNFDDRRYVTRNPWVRSGITRDGVLWALTTFHQANWHPLTWLSLMLDAQIGGSGPAPFHLTSLLLHTTNAILLFLVLERMTGRLSRSAFVAVLFAVHPLHVESVAWIAERKDVLSTLFWFLTLLAYERYVRAPGRARFFAVVATFALGLMAKPMLVTLPLLLLLLDFWPLGRLETGGWPRLVLEKTPLFLLSALSSWVTFVAQRRGGAVESLEALPLWVRVANAFVSYVAYGVQTLWPRSLAALYPHPGSALPAGRVAASALLLAAATLVALRSARSRPYVTVGWLWYLVTLVPVIGVVQVGMQARADRYTYVPLVGLFVVVAWGLPDLLARTRLGERLRGRALRAAGVAVVLALMAAAHAQVGTWRNSRALFEHALAVTEGNYLAESALGSALAVEGSLDEAVPHILEAVRIHPGFIEAHAALATVLFRQGKIEQAAAEWNEALALKPSFAEARAGLAAALLARGKTEEAIAQCRQALREHPGQPTALTHLGYAHLREGKVDEAISDLREALRSDPDQAPAHGYLGAALLEQGTVDEAIAHFRESLRIDPSFPEDHFNLANALLRQARTDEAIVEYRQALRLQPDHTPASIALGVLLAQEGRLEEATDLFREAVRLAPGSAEARLNLGVALFKRGDVPQAISQFESVLRADPGNVLARRYLELAGGRGGVAR